MITSAEIQQELDKAIKRFGTYSYEDKGASEIMDVPKIANQLRATKDVLKVVAILTELDKKQRNEILVRELVGCLDDWNELFATEAKVIKKHY